MKFNKYILILSFIFVPLGAINAYAQQTDIDSLKYKLAKADGFNRIAILIDLSWYYKNIAADTSLIYAKEAVKLATSESPKLQAEANNSLGNTFQALAHYDSAMIYINKSIRYKINKTDSTDLAISLNNRGIIYDEMGEFNNALESYFQGLEVAHAKNEMLIKANILGNIGIVYKKQKAYDDVVNYYQKALSIYNNLDNQFGISVTSGNLGSVQLQTKQFIKAIENSNKAIIGYKKLGYLRYVPYSLGNIGIAYDSLLQFDLAEKYYLEAIEKHIHHQNDYEASYISKNLVYLYIQLNRLTEANKYADQAIELAKNIKAKEMLKDAYLSKSKVLLKQEKFENAYAYLQKHKALNDSLFEENKVNAIFELQTKYQTKEKENEILKKGNTIENQKLLLQRNTIIIIGLILLAFLLILLGYLYKNRLTKKQQLTLQQKEIEFKEAQLNAIIATQEQERTRFATDLHDSFGQTISILKMNIEMAQKQFTQTNESEKLYSESKIMLAEMYDELRGVCFNLMPTTLIKVGLVDAVSEFVYRINTSGKIKIEVNNYGLENRLEELSEISIYRVVQEWVNNILKYSSAKNVTIQFTTDENELTLTIEDTGVGFDIEELENSNGNGWKNINSRVKLLGGTVEVDSTQDHIGTILILNVPLNYL